MHPDPISLATEIERYFATDVSQAWFPRCVDPNGGFHENYAHDWTQEPDESRSLVFQSRMIWLTARLSPFDPDFKRYCQHGIAYFESIILDEDRLPRMVFQCDGKDHTILRSSYSLAFSIFASAAAFEALGDERILASPLKVFQYLERFHKDANGRGYFENTTKEGVLTAVPARGETDSALFKHQNPHLHLLEAFTDLYRIWPNPQLRLRLVEAIEFFTEDLFSAPGYLEDHISSQGRGDGRINFGHDVEVAHLLCSAATVLEEKQDLALEIGITLLDHALVEGWDFEKGGFWSGRSPGGELNATKVWWVQMEGLMALASFYRLTKIPKYFKALNDQWIWIRDHQIDGVSRGLFPTIDSDGNPFHRQPKGSTWKAAYHDGRALFEVPKILRSLN